MNSWLFVIIGVLIFIIILIIAGYEYRIRKFSKVFGKALDQIISGEKLQIQANKETLESKLSHKLIRLLEITEGAVSESRIEKDELQSLLGDISHQIKTPIANIKMYNNILIEREVSKEKEKEFLTLSNLQIEKLDFLMKSMIKMSRLENGVVQLKPKDNFIIYIIANALAQINQKAEDKKISIEISCEEEIKAAFDEKWTEEAIFNVIDNAVKYTPKGGKIAIEVEELEMYVAVSICDNGIGIDEEEQGRIFQRFYRSPMVQVEEGVGVGLALTREIILKEQGFMKIKSELGKGTKFSIYLPKKSFV
ncbi:sensor histidine kinase [Clostridium culturomicium]|uniref:sensor histidine kinase n=1 Tax=Clostridium culturomicium TaxID=1499683 RepID=UPI000693BDDA|nr:HAMP domain-containing sensor histidine kinase [Clostridium culturomicium]